MPDTDKGLFNKYEVKRIDGKPGRENCQYFVMDLCHDPYAKPALEAYIKALPEEYALLKADLTKLLGGKRFNKQTETVS
jgi:hypothetical protein